MNLISMQTTPAEAKKDKAEDATGMDEPKYPYGLVICVNDDTMQKLGLAELPAVGSTMMLTARCEVCAANAYQSQGGDQEGSFSLQITDMALEGQGKSLAVRLYEKK